MAAGLQQRGGAQGRMSAVADWFQDRLPIEPGSLKELTNEPVPNHLKRWWFALGGTPAYLFVVQIVTGRLGTSALRSVFWHKGKIVYDLRFRDHRAAANSTILPHRISFSMPERGTVVELVYRSIEIDPEIPEGTFTQEPPPGLPVYHVDCDG